MSTQSTFFLPDDFHTFNVVQQEAMHMWVAKTTNRQLILSYDQMQRIRNQFEVFPNRLQWTFDVGDCWTLRREGKAVSVSSEGYKTTKEQSTKLFTPEDTLIPWEVVSIDSKVVSSFVYEFQFGNLPAGAAAHTTIKQVKDVSNLTFVPPWRKGRSAVKIREFLRGQKVPLHRRDDSLVLCYSNGSANYALAVYLEDTDKWVLHADFEYKKGSSVKVALCAKK
jgi:hypothetical protein